MADKYPSLTPYNYCANNPVKLIDPNGMEFDPASESKYVKPYEEEVKTRMLFIDNLRGTNKWNDDYNAQYTEYSNILDEISNLRNDKNNLYKIQNGINLGKGTNGLVSYGGNEDHMNIINISLSSKSDNINLFMGTLAHELKHVYQFYNGELGFVVQDGKQIASSNSKKLEKAAFVRGDMFSGATMLNNGSFKLNHNLNFDNYVLPNTYKKYPDVTNESEFRWAYKDKKVIYNQK